MRPFPLPGKKGSLLAVFCHVRITKITKYGNLPGPHTPPPIKKPGRRCAERPSGMTMTKKNPHFRDSLIALLFNSSLFIFYVIYVIKRKYK